MPVSHVASRCISLALQSSTRTPGRGTCVLPSLTAPVAIVSGTSCSSRDSPAKTGPSRYTPTPGDEHRSKSALCAGTLSRKRPSLLVCPLPSTANSEPLAWSHIRKSPRSLYCTSSTAPAAGLPLGAMTIPSIHTNSSWGYVSRTTELGSANGVAASEAEVPSGLSPRSSVTSTRSVRAGLLAAAASSPSPCGSSVASSSSNDLVAKRASPTPKRRARSKGRLYFMGARPGSKPAD